MKFMRRSSLIARVLLEQPSAAVQTPTVALLERSAATFRSPKPSDSPLVRFHSPLSVQRVKNADRWQYNSPPLPPPTLRNFFTPGKPAGGKLSASIVTPLRLREHLSAAASHAASPAASPATPPTGRRNRGTIYRLRAAGAHFTPQPCKQPPPPRNWRRLTDRERPLAAQQARVLQRIGRGGFGSVHLGVAGGRVVAVKLARRRRTGGATSGEMNAAGLQHPHVIATIAVSPRSRAVVMEYGGATNLRQALAAAPLPPYARRIDYARQVASALEYVHACRVVHLDVKPDNVMLSCGGALCRLADFGSSRRLLEGTAVTNARGGTPGYAAPELLAGRPVAAATDVYSLAMTMWTLRSGERPHGGATAGGAHALVYAVVARGARPPLHGGATELFYDEMMARCWDAAPSRRPSAASVRRALEEHASSAP